MYHSAHRQRKSLGCEHKKRVEKRWRITRADICPGVYGPRLTLYIFYKYMCSLGIEPTTFCAADPLL